MGMYNEVYSPCPDCGEYGLVQISQIVLGFGHFYLDTPDSMLDLTVKQLKELHAEVKDELFYCRNDLCPTETFQHNGESRENKTQLIKKLFGKCELSDEDFIGYCYDSY